ncbi:hypothetical protein D3C73_1159490 [compost metagenome]
MLLAVTVNFTDPFTAGVELSTVLVIALSTLHKATVTGKDCALVPQLSLEVMVYVPDSVGV